MNWAMPWARSPLRVRGPTTPGWNRLSCQITRAKNSSGRLYARADASIIRHTDSRRSASEGGLEPGGGVAAFCSGGDGGVASAGAAAGGAAGSAGGATAGGGAAGCPGWARAGTLASSISAMRAMRAMRLNDQDGVVVRHETSSVGARGEACSRLMRGVDML